MTFHRSISLAIILVAGYLETILGQIPELSDIPKCAQPAILSSLQNSGCDPADINCLCNSKDFISALTTSIQSACDAADQAKVLQAGQQLCPGITAHIPASALPTSSISSDTKSPSPTATPTSSDNSEDGNNSASSDTATGTISNDQGSLPSSIDASSTGTNMTANSTATGAIEASPTAPAGGLLTAPPTSPGRSSPTGNYSSLFGSNFSSSAEEYPEAALVFGKLPMSLLALVIAVMSLAFVYL
ncbi:hypothetical protein EV356DRAFT_567685 [Viridothelium virens]|uniref:CFEM domain-containing protein n=1 Tax=Viridothelium virens TaxID=1048519 RepID=A0A6A6H8P6_VIRVR|nr:hypothetical protein EV356DRAFT_567685 [Viridothelium virens]